MLTNILLLSPATMAPSISASNDAAAAVVASAADAIKMFSAVTADATAASTTTTTAAAKAVVRACACAASACSAALAALWTRCQLALQCLFGKSATLDATPCTSTCPTISTAPTPTAEVTADEAVATATATATATVTTTDAVKGLAVPSDPSALVGASKDGDAAAMDSTDGAAHATGLANEPEEEVEPAQEPVLPRELAEHEPSVDDPLTMVVAEALTARHEALGHVPRDTVLRLVSCLHAQNRGRAFVLAYPLAIVDVALRALECHAFDVAAVYTELSGRWMRCYRVDRLLRKHYMRVGNLKGLDELNELRRQTLTTAYAEGSGWCTVAAQVTKGRRRKESTNGRKKEREDKKKKKIQKKEKKKSIVVAASSM